MMMMMGWSPGCYIPSFMEIGLLVPEKKIFDGFLAHLSRRLIGELIVFTGIRRPSVRQHFQTTSPLKP